MADAQAVSKEISSKLRGYDGLTAAKLMDCPAILEALGTTDPPQAYERFVQAIEALPDDRYLSALKNALRLDQMLPDSLTGRNGRRMLFGMMHSVSEETVKTWEARAIETLAQALTAASDERLRQQSVTYWIKEKRVFHKWVGSFWQTPDLQRMRYDNEHRRNQNGKLPMPFAAHQIGPNESPEVIEINVIFDNDERPKAMYGFGDCDLFDFLTGAYQKRDVQGPMPANELLRELKIDHEGVLADSTAYWLRFLEPIPLRIYGLAWYY
jgi:hypothetical protein